MQLFIQRNALLFVAKALSINQKTSRNIKQKTTQKSMQSK